MGPPWGGGTPTSPCSLFSKQLPEKKRGVGGGRGREGGGRGHPLLPPPGAFCSPENLEPDPPPKFATYPPLLHSLSRPTRQVQGRRLTPVLPTRQKKTENNPAHQRPAHSGCKLGRGECPVSEYEKRKSWWGRGVNSLAFEIQNSGDIEHVVWFHAGASNLRRQSKSLLQFNSPV